MNIISDFELFRDSFGFNQLDPNKTSQNGALFTVEYLICLLNNESVPEHYKQSEIIRIKKLFESIEPFPGVSCRYPNDKEFDSMDNAGTLYVFSALYGNNEFAQRAYNHGLNTRATGVDQTQAIEFNNKYYPIAKLINLGKEPNFFWNNNNPNLFCFFGWHGRSPAFIAMLKWCAGLDINIFQKLGIIISQFIGLWQEGMDSKKLSYIGWQFLKTKGFIWKLLYKLWGKILLSKFSGGMKEVYSKYYRPDHPIIKYSKELI